MLIFLTAGENKDIKVKGNSRFDEDEEMNTRTKSSKVKDYYGETDEFKRREKSFSKNSKKKRKKRLIQRSPKFKSDEGEEFSDVSEEEEMDRVDIRSSLKRKPRSGTRESRVRSGVSYKAKGLDLGLLPYPIDISDLEMQIEKYESGIDNGKFLSKKIFPKNNFKKYF